MGKAGVIFLGLIFDVLALVCWILAASQASTEYMWYGIVFFAAGIIIGSIGSGRHETQKAQRQ